MWSFRGNIHAAMKIKWAFRYTFFRMTTTIVSFVCRVFLAVKWVQCWRFVLHYSFFQVVATTRALFSEKRTHQNEEHVYKWPKFRPNIYALRSFLGRAFEQHQECRPNHRVRTIARWCLQNRCGARAFVFSLRLSLFRLTILTKWRSSPLSAFSLFSRSRNFVFVFPHMNTSIKMIWSSKDPFGDWERRKNRREGTR